MWRDLSYLVFLSLLAEASTEARGKIQTGGGNLAWIEFVQYVKLRTCSES